MSVLVVIDVLFLLFCFFFFLCVCVCVVCVLCFLFFFFQAEDGIRDLVRSRGLGDVYKRQGRTFYETSTMCTSVRNLFKFGILFLLFLGVCSFYLGDVRYNAIPVSYTHLTLPTSDLV